MKDKGVKVNKILFMLHSHAVLSLCMFGSEGSEKIVQRRDESKACSKISNVPLPYGVNAMRIGPKLIKSQKRIHPRNHQHTV